MAFFLVRLVTLSDQYRVTPQMEAIALYHYCVFFPPDKVFRVRVLLSGRGFRAHPPEFRNAAQLLVSSVVYLVLQELTVLQLNTV